MHLARQKVQVTFFSTKMTFRKEQKNTLFVERAILHVVKRNNFVVLFWCIWQGKKHKWRSFLQRWPSKRNKKNALFVERAIVHVVKRNNFLSFSDEFGKAKSTSDVLFYKDDLQKGTKKCSFCGESHSSCSQKEQFYCPFLMHLAMQKVQVTFFSREMTFRKEQKKISFCGESHSSCSQKEQFFCPFLMHLARQKVQITFSRKMMLRKEQKNALFVKRSILHVVKRNNFVVLFWCVWQGKKYKWPSFLERWC